MKKMEFIIDTEDQKKRNRPAIEKILIRNGKFLQFIFKHVDADKIKKTYKKCVTKYSYENSEVVGNYCGRHRFKEFYHKNMIGCDGLKTLPFEDTWLPVYEKTEDYLRLKFGENFMELPPLKFREQHGDIEII